MLIAYITAIIIVCSDIGSDKALISRFHRIVGIGNSSYPMAIYQNGQFLRQQQQKYR